MTNKHDGGGTRGTRIDGVLTGVDAALTAAMQDDLNRALARGQAVFLAKRLMAKHSNDIKTALEEWRIEMSKASPERLAAICEAFFLNTFAKREAQ